jgi:hypothetical protein
MTKIKSTHGHNIWNVENSQRRMEKTTDATKQNFALSEEVTTRWGFITKKLSRAATIIDIFFI